MYNKKLLSKIDLGKFTKSDPYKKDIIYDPMGQWKYPGQNTRIPSGNITMKGLNKPLLGVASTGEKKMMQPGQEYNFPGAKYVDEFPQAKEGMIVDLSPAQIEEYRKGGYIIEELDAYDNGGESGLHKFIEGGPSTPEEWEKEIKVIESQIGNPNGWSLSDYNLLQDKLNAYRDWRENTPEGQAVIDYHNEEGEYDIPLPEHLQDYTNAMMKSKLAYANEFRNPAAQRMINMPDNPYQFDNGDTGTHYMASMDNYAVPQIQDENGQLMLGDYGPDSREAMRFDSDEDANYFAENYKDVSPGFINEKKEGGASEQKIIFSPMEGGCPEGQYWTGTECKIIPKNTKIVYSEAELAKSNITKKEQQKLYNQYITRVNNHNTYEAARFKKYGTISAKDKFYKTFESIPGTGWDPWMSYGSGKLMPTTDGIPYINEPMVPFNQWKKMMDKSSVKPIGFKGNPGRGHFYPVYGKPSNYLLGYNKEEEPIIPTTRTVYIDCPPGSVSNGQKTEVTTFDPDSPGNYLKTITNGCDPIKEKEVIVPTPTPTPDIPLVESVGIQDYPEELKGTDWEWDRKYHSFTTPRLNKHFPLGPLFNGKKKHTFSTPYLHRRKDYEDGGIYDPFTQGVSPDLYFNKLKDFKFEKGNKKGFDPTLSNQVIPIRSWKQPQFPVNKRFKKGGDLPPKVGVSYLPKGERSYYDPIMDNISLDLNASEGELNHEMAHAWQNRQDGFRSDPYSPKLRPSAAASDEQAATYFNRKGDDVDRYINNLNTIVPELGGHTWNKDINTFIPDQIKYDKVIDPLMYSDPTTLEGEAEYMAQVYGRPPLEIRKQGGLHKFLGGGSTDCPKDHVWDSNTKKCVKVYTLANDQKFIDGVGNWAMQSNDPDKISPEYNDQIKHYLYSGNYGYDPVSGTLYPLKKEQKTVADAETKKILAKQDDKAAYTQSIIDAGFDPKTFGKSKGTNVITGEEIYGDKSQEDVDKINKEAVNDFVTEGHRQAILESPFNIAASFTPMGMAAGVMQGGAALLPDAYSFAKDPSWSGAGAIGGDLLMMAPGVKSFGKGVVNYGNDIIQTSKQAGKFELPKYSSTYRVEHAGFNTPSSVDDVTGRWFVKKPKDVEFYVDKLKDPGTGEVLPFGGKNPVRIMRERLPEYKIKEQFGAGMPEEARTMSMGRGNFTNEGLDNLLGPGAGDRFTRGKFINSDYNAMESAPFLFREEEGILGANRVNQLRAGTNQGRFSSGTTTTFDNQLDAINHLKNEQKIIDSQSRIKQFLPFKEGGYIDLDLDEDQINEYKEGGYIIEELDAYDNGGEPCPQGFQEDPVTGDCVVITERTQDIQEVSTNQYSPYISKYEESNPRDAYVYQKKADYLRKNKGLNKMAGLSQDNFNTDVEGNFNSNWEYDRNSEVIKQFAKDHGINPKNHVELVEKMADKGNVSYDMIANSKYGSKLQPSLWARSLAGAQELGNAVVKLLPGEQGDVFNKQIKGLTKKENADIHNSKLGALEALAIADLPGAVVMNAIRDVSTASGGNYQVSPGILTGELKSNVSEGQAALANPFLYTGIGDLAVLGAKGIQLAGAGLKGAQSLYTGIKAADKLIPFIGQLDNAAPLLSKVDNLLPITRTENIKSVVQANRVPSQIIRKADDVVSEKPAYVQQEFNFPTETPVTPRPVGTRLQLNPTVPKIEVPKLSAKASNEQKIMEGMEQGRLTGEQTSLASEQANALKASAEIPKTYPIGNPDYFIDLLSMTKMSAADRKFYTGIVDTVKAQGNMASDFQKNMLERIRSGNFNFSGSKGNINAGLSPELITNTAGSKNVVGGRLANFMTDWGLPIGSMFNPSLDVINPVGTMGSKFLSKASPLNLLFKNKKVEGATMSIGDILSAGVKNGKVSVPKSFFKKTKDLIKKSDDAVLTVKNNKTNADIYRVKFDPAVEGSNFKVSDVPKKQGIFGRKKNADFKVTSKEDIPLTEVNLEDPGITVYRRIPFSNRYAVVDKAKLIEGKAQWATTGASAQKFAESFGKGLIITGATGALVWAAEPSDKEKKEVQDKWVKDQQTKGYDDAVKQHEIQVEVEKKAKYEKHKAYITTLITNAVEKGNSQEKVIADLHANGISPEDLIQIYIDNGVPKEEAEEYINTIIRNDIFIKKKGGEILDLTENEINEYKKGGWIVEEVEDTLLKKADGGTVSQLWQQYTGTPWSEAKKQGLTDGSFESNISLRKKILEGEFGEAKIPNRKETPNHEAYKNMVSRMISKGATLEDLVAKRIGTKEGLVNMFSELRTPVKEDLRKYAAQSKPKGIPLPKVFPKQIENAKPIVAPKPKAKDPIVPPKVDVASFIKNLQRPAIGQKAVKVETPKDILSKFGITTFEEPKIVSPSNIKKYIDQAFTQGKTKAKENINENFEKDLFNRLTTIAQQKALLKPEPINKVEPIPNSMAAQFSKQDFNKKSYDANGKEIKNITPKMSDFQTEYPFKETIEDTGKFIKNTKESIGEYIEYVDQGIIRKSKTYGFINDDDIKVPELKENDNPLGISEYYKNLNSTQQSFTIPNSNRNYKQQVLPISNIKLGYRNRGDYNDIESEGLELTTFHPFTNSDKLKNITDNTSVFALDADGNLHTGQFKDFKNNKDWKFSQTYMNKIIDIEDLYVDGSKSGNPGYKQPKVKVLENGKIKDGSLNILTKGKDKDDYYGSIQGGRILFVNPVTKEQYLVSGSLSTIKKEFKKLKGTNQYLEAWTLDNGTYSRGLSYDDKKLTADRLKAYDNENSSGGNGLYIMNYKTPVNEYEEEYVLDMPNLRTKNDASYKKGHKLKNEVKNIVLHHTAYEDTKNNYSQVRNQYMTPGKSSSHVVIEEDGKRTVYASPEQVTFHAGESEWNGRKDVNDFSIGVEFQGNTVNTPLTDAQIKSFIEYYRPIATKYNLSLKDVISHQMISPDRKPDVTAKEYQRILKYMKEKGFK